MIRVNENFGKLQASYLFSEISGRVNAFQEANPEREIIKLGIGDVVQALPQACIDAFHRAVNEMGHDSTFRGYGPVQGYAFLRKAIAKSDYESRGVDISEDEVYISDGSKCDTANIQELFHHLCRIAVPDPVYPVYVDTSVIAGRTGGWRNGCYEGLLYLASTEDNGFVPEVPQEPVDLIYLCFPNNPTGAVISQDELANWVAYARENRALILYDATYVMFIRDDALPHSIFEIDGAKQCAIEFRSFSKTAGFTGTRCAYTVIPRNCVAYDKEENPVSLGDLWYRRQSVKFNGVSYPVQCAAEAVFTEEGKKQTRDLIDSYLANAALIRQSMNSLGYRCFGGGNEPHGGHSPYIWVNGGGDSWQMFDRLLQEAGVVVTPGIGFGPSGQGFIRISAFGHPERIKTAITRISDALG